MPPMSAPQPPPRSPSDPDNESRRRRAKALEHLETAEAAILTWSRALEELEDGAPSLIHILTTVLASISKATGLLEED